VERIWKAVAVTWSRDYRGICLEWGKPWKVTQNRGGPADIRTRHLDANLERYRYSNPLGVRWNTRSPFLYILSRSLRRNYNLWEYCPHRGYTELGSSAFPSVEHAVKYKRSVRWWIRKEAIVVHPVILLGRLRNTARSLRQDNMRLASSPCRRIAIATTSAVVYTFAHLLLLLLQWLSSPYRALASSLWGSVILHIQTAGRTPWTSDQPVARTLHTQDNTNTEYTQTNIHASSGIRTHDPSVQASEDISCLRPRAHCDRPFAHFTFWKLPGYIILISLQEYATLFVRPEVAQTIRKTGPK
jgi:hypothetical protein